MMRDDQIGRSQSEKKMESNADEEERPAPPPLDPLLRERYCRTRLLYRWRHRKRLTEGKEIGNARKGNRSELSRPFQAETVGHGTSSGRILDQARTFFPDDLLEMTG